MRVVLGDTGPLYAAIDEDDADHDRARRDLTRLADEAYAVMVAFPTMLEAYTLILRQLGLAHAHRWLGEIQQGAILTNPDANDYRAATATVRRYTDQAITLHDAVLATMSARLGVEVWTYDFHFDVMRASIWR